MNIKKYHQDVSLVNKWMKFYKALILVKNQIKIIFVIKMIMKVLRNN